MFKSVSLSFGFRWSVSRDKDHRQSGRTGDESRTMQRERSFNGPITSIVDRTMIDHRPINGVQGSSRPTSGMSMQSGQFLNV